MTILAFVWSLVLFLVILLFVVYPWCMNDKNLALWYLSQIKVEVWNFDEPKDCWKFEAEIYLEDWLVANGRLMSEVDPDMVEEYLDVNWIAWKEGSTLPLPALFVDKERLGKMNKMDLTGPYGYQILDNEVSR